MTNRTYGALALTALFAPKVFALGLIDESQATLTTRNFYLERDYRSDVGQDKAQEWAQGFIFRFKSGYSQGNQGYGLDVLGLSGFKLDSSPSRTGTDLLPVSRTDGRAADEYSELGLTGKLRYSKTDLKAGTLDDVFIPFVFASQSRLLPQTFRGAALVSNEWENLTLRGTWFDRTNKRNSTDYEPLSLAAPNQRFNAKAQSDQATFLAVEYHPKNLYQARFYHGDIQDLYRMEYADFKRSWPIGSDVFTTDFRGFYAYEDGSAKAGDVDYQNLTSTFTYQTGAHLFNLGYQHAGGDTAMPYLAGTEILVLSEYLMSSDFVSANEKAWQAKYVYDFAGLGTPGLKTTLRYMKGYDIKLPERLGGSGLSESEKHIEVSYVIQSGSPLAGLNFRARYSIYRNDFASTASMRDENQLRLNVDYSWKLW
ncbi:outer membrane porin, OprD family [Pseudomonas alkylphenolica]|uniref:Outer membrane porin, OprD family n=1 Tax=Pseudomonas alkylphenolica TaxID=237609 RepID=A0A443ZW99_9PSED|nr:OprD family outer membrane porin [Pseudomonas alkylphenolica]RWU25014.1 outer membrane porin, OprD family [Pseudomonas alkylphenolica]